LEMEILVTNDDGFGAPGLAALVRALSPLGDVIVVAPECQQSGVGHRITFGAPIEVREAAFDGAGAAYAISGSPADCVKLALVRLFPGRIGMVASGINPGPNVGVNVHCSGTVAAAMEAVLYGVKALAVSLNAYDVASYDAAARYAAEVARDLLEGKLPAGVVFNLNVPDLAYEWVKGLRATRHSRVGFRERYEEVAAQGRGATGFSLVGEPEAPGSDMDMDAAALAAGWASLTPLGVEMTAEEAFRRVRDSLGGASRGAT